MLKTSEQQQINTLIVIASSIDHAVYLIVPDPNFTNFIPDCEEYLEKIKRNKRVNYMIS